VDVTDIPGVRDGDVATLIGTDGDERISAEELAENAGTINYEILARLSPLLPRIVVE
jgi:alanine racemase